MLLFKVRRVLSAPAVLALALSGGSVVWSAPPAKIEGEGAASFKATVSSGTSNANGAAFTSTERDEKSGFPVSTSLATTNGTTSSVVALLFDQKRESGKTQHQRGFSLALASRGGFRAGQTFPIVAPQPGRRPQTLSCVLTYSEIELTKRQFKSLGSKRSATSRKIRSWVATSGTLRLNAISENKLTFSISNARFSVPQPSQKNEAKGVFLVNGQGLCKFGE